MGTENNAVAGFQTDQSLENSGGSRIGGGDHGCHDADGLSNLPNPVGFVFFNHAAGSGVPIRIVDIFAGIVVLDDFVLDHAHAGFFHGELCQRDAGLIGGCGSGQKDSVDLLLGISGIDLLCGTYPSDGCLQRFYAVHRVIRSGFHTVPPRSAVRRPSHGDRPAIKRCFPDAPSRRKAL